LDEIMAELHRLHCRLDARAYGATRPARAEYTREQIAQQSADALRLYAQVMR
jgi:hypothetical protein